VDDFEFAAEITNIWWVMIDHPILMTLVPCELVDELPIRYGLPFHLHSLVG
jgi:hypothetical protein